MAAEKLLFEGVILSEAKDLLFAFAEKKADPSIAHNRRDLRMTLLRLFQQPLKRAGRSIPEKAFTFFPVAKSLVRLSR